MRPHLRSFTGASIRRLRIGGTMDQGRSIAEKMPFMLAEVAADIAKALA